MNLNQKQFERYARHIAIPEIGIAGQQKLLSAKVLCIGAGGLGSPVALYLAAAGIGTIGIVDYDTVDFTNLQRQIIHNETNIGRSKVESAKERIHSVNSDIKVHTYKKKLNASNALKILKSYDIIVDCTDNFSSRYLINDACVLLKKLDVYGSIFRFEGQVTVFNTSKGPCYRCLYPKPPPPDLAPSCAQAGVLGVLPGLVGCIQATEVIKLVLGKGESLMGRLLTINALDMRIKEVKIQKDPDCPICSFKPKIKTLVDYKESCNEKSLKTSEHASFKIEITSKELKKLLNKKKSVLILDVREPYERAISRIEGSILIPLNELPRKVKDLKISDEIITYCHHGNRSLKAAHFLRKKGFSKARSLKGGINSWIKQS